MSDPIGDLVYETMMSGDIPEDLRPGKVIVVDEQRQGWAELQVAVAKAKADMARAEREAVAAAATAALRDQFAMAALTGLFASSQGVVVTDYDLFARRAYRAADEMLKARDG